MVTDSLDKDPLYVIIEESSVSPRERKFQFWVSGELERIKGEEEVIILEEPVQDTSTLSEYSIPDDRPLKVCGAYRESCVLDQVEFFEEQGYNAELYPEGSYSFYRVPENLPMEMRN